MIRLLLPHPERHSFGLGVVGFLTKRNLITIFMSID
jgi:NADH:ubiquinone oxidoreductase subunit K